VTQIDRINGLIGSIAVKAPCRVATTANITLSGEQAIDGVSVVADARVLVKTQTSSVDNGIYNVSATSWARAADFNGKRDIVKGTLIRAIEGTDNIGVTFEINSSGTTIGTSSITFITVPYPPFSSGDAHVEYFDNVAALRAITSTPPITYVVLKGYYTDGDGGGGFIYWDASSTDTDDGVKTFKATAITTGRWKRNLAGVLSVKQAGAKGDGVVDDQPAIQAAITASPDRIIYAPAGSYLLNSSLSFTSTTGIVGDGMKVTIFMADFNGGYAFNISAGIYDAPTILKDIKLQLQNPATNTTGGVTVNDGAWGQALICTNVSMARFTANSWDIAQNFNTKFDNVVTIGYDSGGTRYGTLLNFPAVSTFANLFSAKNSVFFNGLIGIKNLGCVSSSFQSCTFEALNLFLNVEFLTGYTVRMSFDDCWFEIIENGIVNSRLETGLLTPEFPIVKQQPISRISFTNNYSSASLPTYFLNTTVEPERYLDFYVKDGYQPSKGFVPQFYDFENTQTAATDFTQTYDLTRLNSPSGFGTRQFFTIKVTVQNSGGNTFNAIYSCSSLNAPAAIMGVIYDQYGAGSGAKLTLTWSANRELQVFAEGPNLTKINVDICTFGTLAS